jgi:hypothetical protein
MNFKKINFAIFGFCFLMMHLNLLAPVTKPQGVKPATRPQSDVSQERSVITDPARIAELNRMEKEKERRRALSKQTPEQKTFHDDFMKKYELYIKKFGQFFKEYEPFHQEDINQHFIQIWNLDLQYANLEERIKKSYELLMNKRQELINKYNSTSDENVQEALEEENRNLVDKVEALNEELEFGRKKIILECARLEKLDAEIVKIEGTASAKSGGLIFDDPELSKLSSSLQEKFFKILKPALIEHYNINGMSGYQDVFKQVKQEFLKDLNQ